MKSVTRHRREMGFGVGGDKWEQATMTTFDSNASVLLQN